MIDAAADVAFAFCRHLWTGATLEQRAHGSEALGGVGALEDGKAQKGVRLVPLVVVLPLLVTRRLLGWPHLLGIVPLPLGREAAEGSIRVELPEAEEAADFAGDLLVKLAIHDRYAEDPDHRVEAKITEELVGRLRAAEITHPQLELFLRELRGFES